MLSNILNGNQIQNSGKKNFSWVYKLQNKIIVSNSPNIQIYKQKKRSPYSNENRLLVNIGRLIR